MTTIKTYESNPGLAELKVSYKRRRAAADAKQLSMPFVVSSSTSAEKYLRELWDPDTIELREEFVLLCLGSAHQVLGWIRLSTGGLDSTVVDPRLLFAVALQTASSAIIVAHNHPSGSLTPSKIDIETTRRIAAGAQAVGLKFLDHIIVGRDDTYSMARAGLLDA